MSINKIIGDKKPPQSLTNYGQFLYFKGPNLWKCKQYFALYKKRLPAGKGWQRNFFVMSWGSRGSQSTCRRCVVKQMVVLGCLVRSMEEPRNQTTSLAESNRIQIQKAQNLIPPLLPLKRPSTFADGLLLFLYLTGV
ncbi:hypothetical protein SDC9_65477 [bioreactor metagenome]|uniref:Uncharacterized protein n=1 Tax=bioreactor metagenome TaxID=1076179 RepID=A0A644XSJ7_9ZZZZ